MNENKELVCSLFNVVNEIIYLHHVSDEFLERHLLRIEFNLYGIIDFNKNEQANIICKMIISVCYFYKNKPNFVHLKMLFKIIERIFTNNLLLNKNKLILNLNSYTANAFCSLFFESIQRNSCISYLTILLDYYIKSFEHVRSVEWFHINMKFYSTVFSSINTQLEGY
jgi:hypothetical protein